MSKGLNVDPVELDAAAETLEALAQRYEAVLSAYGGASRDARAGLESRGDIAAGLSESLALQSEELQTAFASGYYFFMDVTYRTTANLHRASEAIAGIAQEHRTTDADIEAMMRSLAREVPDGPRDEAEQ